MLLLFRSLPASGRTFLPDRLVIHQRSCRPGNSAKPVGAPTLGGAGAPNHPIRLAHTTTGSMDDGASMSTSASSKTIVRPVVPGSHLVFRCWAGLGVFCRVLEAGVAAVVGYRSLARVCACALVEVASAKYRAREPWVCVTWVAGWARGMCCLCCFP